ncbi:MAG: hypothetical protein FWE11_05255 [Defluviitaleaceae bacterium]|nr:hypothetical protein [Defluviitaleaceae bacterium]
MKKKLVIVFVFFILLLSPVIPVYAGPGGGIGPPGAPPRGRSMPISVTFIDLNDL